MCPVNLWLGYEVIWKHSLRFFEKVSHTCTTGIKWGSPYHSITLGSHISSMTSTFMQTQGKWKKKKKIFRKHACIHARKHWFEMKQFKIPLSCKHIHPTRADYFWQCASEVPRNNVAQCITYRKVHTNDFFKAREVMIFPGQLAITTKYLCIEDLYATLSWNSDKKWQIKGLMWDYYSCAVV